jgi:hypothetical protein
MDGLEPQHLAGFKLQSIRYGQRKPFHLDTHTLESEITEMLTLTKATNPTFLPALKRINSIISVNIK